MHEYPRYQPLGPGARKRRRDPFLVRLFLLVGAIVMLAPIAFILRSGGGNTVQSGDLPGAAAALGAGNDAAGVVAGSSESTAAVPVSAAAASVPVATVPVVLVDAPVVTEPAAVSLTRPPRTTTFNCPSTYEVVFGDYWVAIAKAHQVTLDELLRQNDASAEQPLYPGRILCLPENATAPVVTAAAPKPAAAPRSTEASTTQPRRSTTTSPPTTASPTTTTRPAPTTTKPAPTTTEAPPSVHYGDGEIEAIIRAVWPDDLEDKALQVADRESSLDPQVRNYCCFGLFQIYYDKHRSWLADLGVQSAADLYDPQVNTYAAFVLYQRAGGWGPWGG